MTTNARSRFSELPSAEQEHVFRYLTLEEIRDGVAMASKSTKKISNDIKTNVNKKLDTLAKLFGDLINFVKNPLNNIKSFRIVFDNSTAISFTTENYNTYNNAKNVVRSDIKLNNMMNEIFSKSITSAQFLTEEETIAHAEAVNDGVIRYYAKQLGPSLSNVQSYEIENLETKTKQTNIQARNTRNVRDILKDVLNKYIADINKVVGGRKKSTAKPMKVPKKKKVN